MNVDLFDFNLPKSLIAERPESPRDHSRMLVLKDGSPEDKNVFDLPSYLKPNDVIVLNDTRVIPARLYGKSSKSNRIFEIFLNKQVSPSSWSVFAKPAKYLEIGDKLFFLDNLRGIVENKTPEITILFDSENLWEIINNIGETPLPPYILKKRKADNKDKEDYQTVFAREGNSIAAPTAGLHFTKELLEKISDIGVDIAYVNLDVGAGTFMPVKTSDTKDHLMHEEHYNINQDNADKINKAKKNGGRIIAVGTTSLRVLETVASNGKIQNQSGETSIFITPGYKFKIVDMLLTNFHLPKSTLFMLVSAFIGIDNAHQLYSHAIKNNYRFYSYGDATLLYKKYDN